MTKQYGVSDLTKSIRKRCGLYNLAETSDHMGYFGFNAKYQAYIEVISFDGLVNSARFFRLDSSHAELATEALRSCHYQIAGVEDETQLSIMLNGLATVAAVTRNHALADELRIVARRYRPDVRHSISAGSEIIACLTAAASRSSLEDWTEFAGSRITELAFTDELKDDEAHMLHSQLRYLLHSVPELWITCGRACAALAAIDKNTFSEYEGSFPAEP